MDRISKQKLIRDYSELFDKYKAVFFVRNKGLSVSESESIRSQLKKSKTRFLFIKNSLARKALDGKCALEAKPYLFGPLAIACSDDPIPSSRLLIKVCGLTCKLDIVGGMSSGKVLNKDDVSTLATMPTQDEIRVMLIHLLRSTAFKVVTILNKPAVTMARMLQSYAATKK